MKKVKIGIFSFTCDEGCSINFLEILNSKFEEWKKFLDFKHFRLIQSKSNLKSLDIAFIEGAISTKKEKEKAKKIRKIAKKVIAIGNCAIEGFISAQRNSFDEDRRKEIKPILKKFGHMDRVLSVKDVIEVDDEVPGCPMLETKFIEIMEKYLKEFGVK